MVRAKNNLHQFSCSHHILAATINHTYPLPVQNTFELISFRTELRHRYIATELRRKYIRVSGCRLWQALPEFMQGSPNVHIFKALVIKGFFQVMCNCLSIELLNIVL